MASLISARSDDLVADLRADQRVLEHPRLGVGAVEDGDLLARDALVDEPLDLARHVARLGVLVGKLAHLCGIALAEVGPQRLGHPPTVVRHDGVGDAQDGLGRAVVLLEADGLCLGEGVLEAEDVGDVGAAEGVDAVVRDQPVGDEVVGRLDVEVVDGGLELRSFDALHEVGLAFGVPHRHARLDELRD